MTTEMKRQNVVYARTMRALFVLLWVPASAARETAHPDRANALLLTAMIAGAALSGWMHRTAVERWASTDLPDPTPPPTPQPFTTYAPHWDEYVALQDRADLC